MSIQTRFIAKLVNLAIYPAAKEEALESTEDEGSYTFLECNNLSHTWSCSSPFVAKTLHYRPSPLPCCTWTTKKIENNFDQKSVAS